MNGSVVTDFERQVLEDLAEIKTNMHWLIGDGQPGVIQELAGRVDRHEQMVQRLTGVGGFLAALLTLIHFGLDYFRLHR